MTTMRTIRILVSCLGFVGAAVAAESLPSLAGQLVGRWESTSFVTTNCIVAKRYPGEYMMLATNLDLRGMDLESHWMSASFVATDNTRQTNLILCVYEVIKEWIDPTTKKRCAELSTELHFTDHAGRERSIQEASGIAILSGNRIEFGSYSGYWFSSQLANGVWALETFGLFRYPEAYYKVRVKAALEKVSSEPGELMRVWWAEPDGAANASQPIRSETNRTSSAAGPDR